jgi:hypothetical protein
MSASPCSNNYSYLLQILLQFLPLFQYALEFFVDKDLQVMKSYKPVRMDPRVTDSTFYEVSIRDYNESSSTLLQPQSPPPSSCA